MGNSRARDEVSRVLHRATELRFRGRVDRSPSLWRKGSGVELAEGGGEVRPRALGNLLQAPMIVCMKGQGEGGVKETLPSPLHVVPETGDVLQGYLRLG